MKLRPAHYAFFAAPAIPIAALGMPLVVYLPALYAEDLGLGLTMVGMIFGITRLWDIATDVMLGTLTDQVRTRFGRRRPWIVIATPIVVVCAWRLFMPPEGAGPVYLSFWLVALYVGWTMLTISHMAWGAELSDDYHVRSRLQGWRQAGLLTGMICVLALPVAVEQHFGESGTIRAAAMGWFVIALLPITVALAVGGVGERPPRETGKRASTLTAYRLALTNRLMWRVLSTDLLAGIGAGVTASLYVFFVEHAMRMPEWTSLFLLMYFLAGLASIPFWLRISYRFGKHKTLATAMFYMSAVLPFMFLIEPGDVFGYGAINVVYGLGYGAAPVLLRSITADVTDDDSLRSGTQRAGLFFSLLTLTNKLGFATAVGIAYPLIGAMGFDPDSSTNAVSAITALRNAFILIPLVCFGAGAVVMWRFPLDETRQAELRADVESASTRA